MSFIREATGLFKVNGDGTSFTNIYLFKPSPAPTFTNGDGANPIGRMVLSGSTLYGTANGRGAQGQGTVFAISTNGAGFTNLFNFTNTSSFATGRTNKNGANPNAGVLLSGGALFGTTFNGGVFGGGTVFRMNTNGTGFTNLHSFAKIASYPNNTNSDGARPGAGILVLSGNTLYGTTTDGGQNGNGTIFAMNTNGTGFTNLHVFGANSSAPYTNSDGTAPRPGLILSGGTLYGAGYQGGSGASGTIFAISTNGTGFTTLHNFAPYGIEASGNSYTNSDGAFPISLVLSGNTLYGATQQGGSGGGGTIFAMNTNGSGFTKLYSFSQLSAPSYLRGTNAEGAYPSSLMISGSTLYGTTSYGGNSANGSIFSINLALNIKTNGMAVSKQTGGTAELAFLGVPGAKYALEWAHTFAAPTVWTPITTNTTTPDGYLFFTNTITLSNDFYRVRFVP